MIFIIGFAFIFPGLIADDGWPALLLGGGGLVVVGAFSYLDGVL